MPPPTPNFWKKVDENQVCYFIWPKVTFLCASFIYANYVPVA